MKFDSIKDVQAALIVIRAKRTGKNIHYPPLFKKAICEFVEENGYTVGGIAKTLEINESTVYYWKDQFKRDLYTLEGAYCVSQKSKDINGAIIVKIQKKIASLQKRMALVKQCSENDIKVANEA